MNIGDLVIGKQLLEFTRWTGVVYRGLRRRGEKKKQGRSKEKGEGKQQGIPASLLKRGFLQSGEKNSVDTGVAT